MSSITRGGPKELLSSGGKPLIAHALDEAILAGSAKAVVIIRQGKEDVVRALRHYAPPGFELVFECQAKPLGECDAIALARPHTGNELFGVFYPDNIPAKSGALAETAQTASESGLDTVALMRVDPDLASGLSNSGRVDMDRSDDGGYRITRFLPKGHGAFQPRFPNEMRTCGIYVALPHYYDFIEQVRVGLEPGQELTDGKVRRAMLAAGIEIAGAPLEGTVFDAGNPVGYTLSLQSVGP